MVRAQFEVGKRCADSAKEFDKSIWSRLLPRRGIMLLHIRSAPSLRAHRMRNPQFFEFMVILVVILCSGVSCSLMQGGAGASIHLSIIL